MGIQKVHTSSLLHTKIMENLREFQNKVIIVFSSSVFMLLMAYLEWSIAF